MVTYKIHPGIGLARSAIRTLAMRTGLTVFEPSLWLRTRRLGIGDQRLAVDFPQMPPKIRKIAPQRLGPIALTQLAHRQCLGQTQPIR
jgi:hypothetical protein